MGKTTTISYATHSWTGIRGCQHAMLPDGTPHNGCTFCFAEAFANRNPKVLGKWGPDGTRVLASPDYWCQPLAWDRASAKAREEFGEYLAEWDLTHSVMGSPERPRVLWDLGDLFEDWQGPIHDHDGRRLWTPRGGGGPYVAEVPQLDFHGVRPLTFSDVRRDMFRLIDRCPNLDWLIPTKRPQKMRRMWARLEMHAAMADPCPPTDETETLFGAMCRAHRRNVWLGYSASDQASLEAGLPHLLVCRDLVPMLWLSLEPLLGPMRLNLDGISWVVCGGESGPRARPCNVEWIRSIRDQCVATSVPCYVKQLGTRCQDSTPGSRQRPSGWKYVMDRDGVTRLYLDLKDPKGGDPDEWPEDLRVRQFPEPATATCPHVRQD